MVNIKFLKILLNFRSYFQLFYTECPFITNIFILPKIAILAYFCKCTTVKFYSMLDSKQGGNYKKNYIYIYINAKLLHKHTFRILCLLSNKIIFRENMHLLTAFALIQTLDCPCKCCVLFLFLCSQSSFLSFY